MRVIGLTGKARAGKDTACGFIKGWGETAGVEVERAAFADKLKVSAARALGFEGDTAQCVAFCNELKQEGMDIQIIRRGPDGAELEAGLSGRRFLQLYGTEAHRGVFGDEFWVEALLDDALPHGPDDPRFGTVLVVSDVRFENEARAIHNCGGEVWEVVREKNPDALSGGLEAHSSEVGVPADLIDRIIINDHDLAYFEREIRLACVEAGIG
jgi:hypothetical protein